MLPAGLLEALLAGCPGLLSRDLQRLSVNRGAQKGTGTGPPPALFLRGLYLSGLPRKKSFFQSDSLLRPTALLHSASPTGADFGANPKLFLEASHASTAWKSCWRTCNTSPSGQPSTPWRSHLGAGFVHDVNGLRSHSLPLEGNLGSSLVWKVAVRNELAGELHRSFQRLGSLELSSCHLTAGHAQTSCRILKLAQARTSELPVLTGPRWCS